MVDTGQAVVDIYCHPWEKFLWKAHTWHLLHALQELLRIPHDWGDEDWPNVFSLPKAVTLNMLHLFCPKIPEFYDTSVMSENSGILQHICYVRKFRNFTTHLLCPKISEFYNIERFYTQYIFCCYIFFLLFYPAHRTEQGVLDWRKYSPDYWIVK